MRKAFSFQTTANVGSYSPSSSLPVELQSRFGHWWAHDEDDPYLCYLTSGGVTGQYRLIWLPWDEFKWIYRFGQQNPNTPIHVSVDHQNNLVLGPTPNDAYTISGDIQVSPQTMALENDQQPEMPAQFHKLIVYYALAKYAANNVAPELVSRAQLEAAKLMSALERNQLPQVMLGEPML